jgi:hypothetical protein
VAREPAAQQRFSGTVAVSLAEHRVDAGLGRERSTGLVLGAGAGLQVSRRLDLAVRAQGGSLDASSSGAVDRDVGEIGIAASVAAGSWLSLQAGVARRVYSTLLARQGWMLAGVGAEAHFTYTGTPVRGLARLWWLPVASVSGLPRPDLAFTAATGLEYRTGAFTLGAVYSLERYDFPAEAAVQRVEQLAALTLRLDVRPGRQ